MESTPMSMEDSGLERTNSKGDQEALPSWSLSRGKKIGISSLISLIIVITSAMWSYGIWEWMLDKTLRIRFVFSMSWAHIMITFLILLSLTLLLFSRIWFKNTVGAQRTLGASKPIQTSTNDLLKKMDPDGTTPVFPGHSNNLFQLESIQDFVEYSEKRKLKRMQSRPSDEDSWFGRSSEGSYQDGELSELQINLYRGCAQLIANLDVPTFQELYSYTKWVHLDQGDSAYDAGESGDSGVFFIVEGSISVLGGGPDEQGDRMFLSSLRPGESFGETEIFEQGTRSVSCVALEPSELVQIPREAFMEIVKHHPESIISFIRTTMARHWKVVSFVLDHYFRFSLDEQGRGYASDSLSELFKDNLPSPDTSAFSHALELNAGDLLYTKGSKKTNRIFVLISGSACVYSDGEVENKKGRNLGPGTVFGAISFFLRCPRVETVRIMSKSVFLWCSIQELESTPQEYGCRLALEVGALISPKLDNFQCFGFSRAWFTAGETVLSPGSPAEDLFIVVSGRIRILEGRRGPQHEVGRGECVGEMALLADRQVHCVHAIALRDSVLVRISRQALDILIEKYPQILRKLSETMAHRLETLNSKMSSSKLSLAPSKSKVSTVAVFPADPSVDVEGFSRNLCRALSQFGSTSYLNKQKMIEELRLESLSESSSDSALRRNLTNILTDLEDSYEFVVFSTEHESSLWTECCIRQADCVFIVASSQASSQVSRLEQDLLWTSESKTFSRKELVLIHPDSLLIPEGTSRWFQDRKLHTFHHVKESQMPFYGRLARYIAGKTMGVVFGGGGARGLAHHGALKCLEEKNIEIDYICGTSQGSFMAAMYAFHLSRDAMEPDVIGFSAKMGNIWELLSDSTFPLMSYFSGRKFSQNIHDFFRETQIEDLWIPYFCVTTNMTTSDICIHRTGSLWKAVRASMSILDYLPPMSIDGELLIDGGYINNLPVDVMKQLYDPHIVIAVDVENKSGITFKGHAFGAHLSGWWLLGHKILSYIVPCYRGPHSSIPRFADIVYSLLYLNHNRNIRKLVEDQLMDIYIAPELGNTMLLDYHKFAEIAEIGYRYAKICITEWQLRNRHLLQSKSAMNHSRSFDNSLAPKRRMSILASSIAGDLHNHSTPPISSRRSRSYTEDKQTLQKSLPTTPIPNSSEPSSSSSPRSSGHDE